MGIKLSLLYLISSIEWDPLIVVMGIKKTKALVFFKINVSKCANVLNLSDSRVRIN